MKKFGSYLRLVTVACVLCFAMTGCGNNDNSSTSGNNDNNAVGDAADDVGDAADDVADGVGNAVDDLVGNDGFDNYNDAHKYFMDTMGSYHSDAKFEVRDEDKELNDYQEGSKGYRFYLYDTSKNENGDLFGEFYVDATSGTIYKKGDNNSFDEYPGNQTGNGTGANNNGTNGTGSNTGNNTSTGNGNGGKTGNVSSNNTNTGKTTNNR